MHPIRVDQLPIQSSDSNLTPVHSNPHPLSNPNQVLLMGQSTGGSDVLCLMASPLARGLFHATYPQSAFAIQTYDNETSAAAVGSAFYHEVGCQTAANATQCMLDQPTLSMLGAQYGHFYTGIYTGPGANTDDHRIFGPVVQPGSSVLPRQPYDAFARGAISDVPLFYWLVAAEGNREMFNKYTAPINVTEFRTTVAGRRGAQNVDRLVALYPFPNDNVRMRPPSTAADHSFLHLLSSFIQPIHPPHPTHIKSDTPPPPTTATRSPTCLAPTGGSAPAGST